MRWLWIVVAVGALGLLGDFTYRTFLRPIDSPTEGMRALASHTSPQLGFRPGSGPDDK